MARFATHTGEFDARLLPDEPRKRRQALDRRAAPRGTAPKLSSSIRGTMAELDAKNAEAYSDIEELLYLLEVGE